MIYAADNAVFPYGILADERLIDRVCSLMEHLIPRFDPDIIVVACNTASTLALESLRQRFSKPFVGVVPAIKPAAALSTSKVIGVLATPATIVREYTDSLIANFATQHAVYRLGSNTLVELAEKHLRNEKVPDSVLFSELSKLIQLDRTGTMDTIVLACTHFPLLKERFRKIPAFSHLQWVDSGNAIARRVSHLLETLSFDTASTHANLPEISFLFTDEHTRESTASAYKAFLNTTRAKVNLIGTNLTSIG